MRADASLLLLAAVFPTWTAADARKEPAKNIHTPLFAHTNHTTKPVSSIPQSDASLPHSLEVASTSIPALSPSFSKPTTLYTSLSTYPHPSLASPPIPLTTGSSNGTRPGNMTWPAPSAPPRPTTPHYPPKLPGSICEGYINGTVCVGHAKTKPTGSHATPPPCIPRTMAVEFLIQYPSTITLYGNSSDYTPPYPPLVLPTRCEDRDGSPSYGDFGSAQPPAATNSVLVVTSNGRTHTTTLRVTPAAGQASGTTTFLTSDKNPAVSTHTDPPPNFSQPWDKSGPANPKSTDSSGSQPGAPGADIQPSKYVITAGPSKVIINKSTFTVLPGQSTTVTVDGSGFTINPSAVIGAGETISRPMGVSKSTDLGGIPVTYANGNVIVDGHTFTKPPSPTTATIDGKYVSISPDGVAVDGQTMKFATATDSIVAGGELLTAIGRSVVVIHSTTLTYGPGVAERVTAVNGDTVSIEPTGIVLHGSTIGGPSANPTDTRYEIVGGATIAKIPPSMVVINGVTYALGPGTGQSTIDAGNEKITLGPEGLVMASMTMSVPFDASVVTTISTTGHSPLETVTDGEDNGATTGKPNTRLGMICICIAIGVLVLG